MKRYIFSAEYRHSVHQEVRHYGARIRLGVLVFLTTMLLLILLMVIRDLWAN